MPLTPAEVHNVEFSRAAIGKRGYHAEEVDALLDEATHEMIRLREENDALQHRIPAHSAQTAPTLAAGDAFAELVVELGRAHHARDLAEQNARRVREQLHEAHGAAAAPEPDGSDAVLAMAYRTADNYVRQAHQSSRELLAEAHDRSQLMAAEAQQEVGEIEQNARRNGHQAANDLETKRAAVLHDIAELAHFADQYQAALESSLRRQENIVAGRTTGS